MNIVVKIIKQCEVDTIELKKIVTEFKNLAQGFKKD